MAVTKTCTKCAVEKPLDGFGKDKSTYDGVHQQCLECRRAARCQWRETHPDENREQFRSWSKANYAQHLARNRSWQQDNRSKMRASMLRSRYNVTMSDYETMFTSQNGKCKICGKVARLVVDHKHDGEGRVRGLLCQRCNTGIGLLLDDPAILRSAIAYVMLDGAFDRERFDIEVRVTQK